MKESLLSWSWIDEIILCRLEAGLMRQFLGVAEMFYNDETDPEILLFIVVNSIIRHLLSTNI